MKKKIDQLFSRLPLLAQYVAKPFLLTFISLGGLLGVVYAILSLFGVYSKLENALDLKASSLWIIVPLFVGLLGAVVSFVVGVLLYRKYKRKVLKTNFREHYAALMADEKKKLETGR